MILSKEKA